MNSFLMPNPTNYYQFYYFTLLKRHQWLNEKDLVQIQETKLRRLIDHAYVNVPYYRALFDSVGVKPQDIISVKDLQKIPILTKESVRENYPNKIVAKDVDLTNCIIKSTTGSTGTPLKFAFSREMAEYAKGMFFFVFSECGLRLTDKYVHIYHESTQKSLLKRLLEKFGISRYKVISIFDPIESILEFLRDFRPDVIGAYPSMLLLLSKKIREQNINWINPRLIITGGETVTDYDRNIVSQTFNSDIRSLYSSEEFSRLAFDCKENSGYHIITDSIIIEIVKENSNVEVGEKGEIVVTGLLNYAMPFIRYNLGDIGTIAHEKCACGRGFPLIRTIEGRKDDYITLPSGKKISPRTINEIGYIQEIRAYKTIQKAKDYFVIKVVKGKGFNENTINEIKKQIKSACLGEEVKVDVQLVKEITKERTGKIRAIISNVKE